MNRHTIHQPNTGYAHRRCPLLPLHEHMRRHHWHPRFLHHCQPPFVEQLNPTRPENSVDANLLEVIPQAGFPGQSVFKLVRQRARPLSSHTDQQFGSVEVGVAQQTKETKNKNLILLSRGRMLACRRHISPCIFVGIPGSNFKATPLKQTLTS